MSDEKAWVRMIAKKPELRAAGDYCDCTDSGCPACNGTCTASATVTLSRVDMNAATVRFCEGCASAALAPGVFA